MSAPVVHGPAAVHETARLGDGCVVWTFATVEAGVVLGADCAVGSHAFVGQGTRCGDRVRIQHGAFITRHTQIGSDVFIGPNVTMTDDRWPRVNNPQYDAAPPIIEERASIGAGAVLLPGVRIGRQAMVGAGAVVTHDVAPFAMVRGVPAREHPPIASAACN